MLKHFLYPVILRSGAPDLDTNNVSEYPDEHAALEEMRRRNLQVTPPLAMAAIHFEAETRESADEYAAHFLGCGSAMNYLLSSEVPS